MGQPTTAVVAGASVAGLAAALVAARHVDRVVVVERHAAPGPDDEPASIVPQGAFPHVLLAGGAAALERLAPGFAEQLRSAGAVGVRGGRSCHWWAAGSVRRSLPDLGVDAPMCSRELVETTLRRRVAAHPRVELRWGCSVTGLEVAAGRVVATRLETPDGELRLPADLVVDATGRSARSTGWLERVGYDAPPVQEIGVDLAYVCVEVDRRDGDLDGAELAVVQNTRTCPRMGVALPTERGRWRVVLGGYFGDRAPIDRPAMVAWAATLGDPAIAGLLDRGWATETRRHAFPSSQRRDWSAVPLPEGFVALGDAVASFNPIYGQGMSSAALQAVALDDVLRTHGLCDGFAHTAAAAAARVAANPWRVAAGSDLVYPETRGDQDRGNGLVNRYLELVMRAAAVDPVVNLALTRVQGLLADPPTLMRPTVVARVLARSRPRPTRRPTEVAAPATVA